MPAVGAAIAAALTKAAVMKFVATVALSLALGAYQQSQARRKARAQERAQRDAYNNSLKDRHVTVRSGVSTRQYVLGTVRVGGTLMHIEANGQDNTALDSVLALAGNKCELVGYYVGDEYVTPAQFPGEKYGNRKQVGKTRTHFVPQGTSTVSIDLGEEILADSVKPVNWFIGDRSPTSFGPVTVTGTTVEFESTSEKGGRILIIYKTYEAEKLRVIYKDGDPNQFTSGWDDVETPLWTLEDHRLRGVAYLRTLNLWDEDIYHSGAPQMGAVLKGGWVGGHRFFDPRTNTYPAYTANPALIAAWWMTLPRGRGGMGIPESWIDWPYVSMAANICDEWIIVRKLDGDGYDSIRRYECHTLLDTANPPVDNLNIVMSSMAGEYVFTAGKYRIFAGAFRTATITITDDDVVGDKDIVMDKSGQDDAPANIVTSTFVNAARNWLESSPRPIRNERYISDDGAESPLDISLPATTDERHAAYLMGVMLESARPAFAGEITVLGVGEDISVLDTLRLQLSNRPQYEGRTFQVVNRIDNWDGTFKLTLQEIRPNIWQLDPDTFLPTDPTPVPDTSYLWNIAPVSGFAVSPQKPQSLTDGKATVRVDLSWGLHPQPYVREGGRIETRYRAPGGEWIWNPAVAGDALGTSFTAVLEDGITYQYQARAVSGLGATSNWTDGWDDYDGLIGAPPALTGLSTESLLSGINVFWTFPGTRNALRHTEIRFSVSDRFDDAALMGHFAWPTDRGTLLKLVPGAKFWFWGRLVDENGTPGPWHPSPDKPGVLGEASTDIDLIQGLITEEIVAGGLGELIMGDIRDIPNIRDAVDEISVDLGELNGRVDEINGQVQELLSAGEWDPAVAYAVGTVVFADGKMYRAKKAVPAGTPVSDAAHWELIGDYASIADGLAALAVQAQETISRVENAEGLIQANAEQISTVAGQVNNPETGLGALGSAVQSMRTQVGQLQDGLQSLSEATTALSSRVDGLDQAQQGLATAVSSLGTRVAATEGQLDSQASSITQLGASVTNADAKAVAAQQAAAAAADAAGAKGEVIFSSTAPPAAKRLAQNLWIDTAGNANTPKRWNGSAWVAVTDKAATDAAAAAAVAKAAADAAQAIASQKADASTVQALTNRVTATEQGLMAQGESVTKIDARLAAGLDSDSLLPDYMMANPDSWYSYYTSQPDLSGNFATISDGVVSPTVFRWTSTERNFNFSKTTLPIADQYRIRAWMRRSANSDGTMRITYKYRKTTDGDSGVQANYSAVDVTAQVPADGQWHLVDFLYKANPVFLEHGFTGVRFGFAINHINTAGWAEIQGYRVTRVAQGADINPEEVATAQSVTSLSGTVTQQGNTITSQGQDLTALQNTVNDPSTGLAATAGALNDTNSRVTSIEGKQEAQATNQLVLNAEVKRLQSDEDAYLESVLNQWQTQANLSEFKSVQADENRALAESITTLTAVIGQDSAAVEEIMRSLVELDGRIAASWGLKLQTNQNGVKYVAGVGLDLTNESGVMQSTFAVLADRFAVMHAVNGSPTTVFSVQGGTSILNSALIGNASIGEAKIADAAISRAKIQGAAIGEAQIENAAITNAKIRDAAISSAKIGDAQVETLKLAGNAVTIHASVTAPYFSPGYVLVERAVNLAFYLPYAADITLIANVEPFTIFNGSGARDAFSDIWYDNGGYIIARVASVRDLNSVLSTGGSATFKGWLAAGPHSITMRQKPSLGGNTVFPAASMVALIAMR
ncbi:DUF1983 domain-containing protein [Alcaligenes phenolicus]|uniref:phage tail protein n=1 Tax=Alcaligenes phenolicus TaxID=232846 RepID=UPI002AA5F18A|nr:DUF1983 domain-containing protein [Alcaligenes phenolicus]